MRCVMRSWAVSSSPGDKAVMEHHLEVLEKLRKTNYELRIEDNSDSFNSKELCAVYQALAALIGKGQNH